MSSSGSRTSSTKEEEAGAEEDLAALSAAAASATDRDDEALLFLLQLLRLLRSQTCAWQYLHHQSRNKHTKKSERSNEEEQGGVPLSVSVSSSFSSHLVPSIDIFLIFSLLRANGEERERERE